MKRSYFLIPLYIFLIFIFISSHLYSENIDLVGTTLALDIDSSDYYDLVTWLKKLDLDTKGKIDELKNRLYDYYKLIPPAKNSETADRTIIIDSANSINYLKDISIDQNLIILEGKVVMKMVDSLKATTHKITADKIIFNETEKTISASGNIIYEINSKSNNELFYGESLVFEIQNWEGIFFEGVSENERVIDNNNISFYFSGDYIYRSNSDKIILNKGSITSSKQTDPYYRLDAEKIWVLRPGEWAIKSAVLYVGRIPMLYVPFFFLPGDKLIINPSIGYKEINGYFINTTTFLLGRKNDAEDDTFSFLKSNNTEEIYETERNGLFLRETDKVLDTEKWPNNTESTIKLLVDYYSRKGYFFAVDGKLQFSGVIKKLNFLSAFSLSKYLFLDNTNNMYTPYRLDDNNNYITDLETSYFLGNEIPVRYAFSFDLNGGTDWLNFNINFPFYSDAQFRKHFLNREEGLKWTEFLENKTDTETTENDLNNISWGLQSSFTPKVDILKPYITQLSLKKFNMVLNWRSTTLQFEDSTLLNNNNYTLEDNLSFYYPSNLILPDLGAAITGSLFESKTNSASEQDNKSVEIELKNPISNNSSERVDNNDNSIIKAPGILEDSKIDTILSENNNNYSSILKYSITPSLSLNSIFNSSTPPDKNDTGFNSDYSILNSRLTSFLDYSLNLDDSLFTFDNKLNFSLNYLKHLNPSQDQLNWDSYLIQDKNATNYNLTNNISLSAKPLFNNIFFSDSTFNYSLNTIVIRQYYDSELSDFNEEYIDWNESTITTHKAKVELNYKSGDYSQIFKFEAVLPPGNTEIYPELILSGENLTGSGKLGLTYIEDVNSSQLWVYDPFLVYLKYTDLENYFKQTFSFDFENSEASYAKSELYATLADSKITLNQQMQYNLNDFSFTRSLSTINLWFINFNLLMEDIPDYKFQLPFGWISSENTYFQPSTASVAVNYHYTPDPFWKNRVNLKLNLNSSWSMNIQKYTDTSLNFGLDLTFSIAEFLDFTFESKSINRATYRYIPGYSENLGLEYLNPLTDLIRSFNFFNMDDRINSNFNIDNIAISAVHHLGDWDLSLKYSGKQDLIRNDLNQYEYKWKTDFSIFLTWRPIPEIKKNINYSEDLLSFD